MNKKEAKKQGCLQPVPKVLISCRGLDGENDILPVVCCCNCSMNPPMVAVGILLVNYSHHMIKESGCFAINLVDQNLQHVIDYMGSHSRRNEDKIAQMGIKMCEGQKINASVIQDCPVNIECKVIGSMVTGSHELFIAQVEHVSADANLIRDDGSIDFSRINFL
jgi:flavin reductase (DIM6/NTAB) family NADH-FMN oxidoreductase RutF